MAVNVDAEYLKEIEKSRRDLRALISSKNCAPIMLRLAWHDAGTYDAEKKTGGPNGSIRFKDELNRQPNKGLEKAVSFFLMIFLTVTDSLSSIQLAGVVAVEVTGGPAIPFTPGRKDAETADEGDLPDANQGASHLRTLFSRMGLTDKDIIALSGGHTLGRAHKERSEFEGPWTQDSLKFDNSYFVELLKGETPGLLQLKTDKALLDDPKFKPFRSGAADAWDRCCSSYCDLYHMLSCFFSSFIALDFLQNRA